MAFNIADNQVLASPVSAFYQGRAIRLAEQKAEREMRALEVAEGRAANQEARAQEAHDAEMEATQMKFGEVRAKQAYAAAQQVMASDSPKSLVEQQFPQFIKDYRSRGGDWDNIDDATVLKLAKGVGARAAAELGIAPEKQFQTIQTEDGAILQKDPKTGELKKVLDANKPPNSYDEFVLAQKDPAFAKFLKERKGKGLSLTMPDGTTLELGDVSRVGPDELSKPTINNLQETIVNSTARLDRLNATLTKYRPEFLRAKGIASAIGTKVKDFVGLEVTDEQRKYLNDYTEFQSSAATDLAQILKEMSGAAVTPQEYERIEKALPSGKELSPTEFEAKSKTAVKTVNRAIMRANWALKAGIGAKSVEQLAKMMPLDGIDAVYEQRANEIWQELGGTPETKAEAIRKANGEFGLAR